MKRLAVLFLLAACLLFLPRAFARGDGAAVAVPGDLNGSGAVDAADAAAILRLLAEDERRGDSLAGDVTQNGLVDRNDALAGLWMAAGKIPDPVKFVERISTGLLPEEAFTRFCYDGSSVLSGGNYQNESVAVTVKSGRAYKSAYYLADVYVQDIRCLKAGYPGDGVFTAARVPALAAQYGALLAVNGDYYTQRSYGPIIRNGNTVVSRITDRADLCVIGWNGVMATYAFHTLEENTLSALHPYQSFAFGPRLLDEGGRARSDFSSDIAGVNPRTVLGYYAPGHYALLVVDGRQGDYSTGMTLTDLSAFCEALGFAAAYNLDGGQSSAMADRDGLISRPFRGGRVVGDVLYLSPAPG